LAAAGSGPVVALLGDLAFLHDVSALVRLGAVSTAGTCVLVVVDNAGGGIFNFLPQADQVEPDRFELLFGTPPGSDLSEVARGFGLEVGEVSTLDGLKGALLGALDEGGLRVVRARVPDRRANVALHERINDAVRAAVAPALAG
jgi:2-succinyl-5-enolpyruvyl-6-hydroxy-3-cyclohexene-1-carboxylate synthase